MEINEIILILCVFVIFVTFTHSIKYLCKKSLDKLQRRKAGNERKGKPVEIKKKGR